MTERPPSRSPVGATGGFGVLQAALWMLGTLLAFSFVVIALSAFLPGALRDLVTLGGLSAVAFLTSSALLLGRDRDRTGTLAFRRVAVWMIPTSFFCGASAQVPARRVALWVENLLPTDATELAERSQMLLPASTAHGMMLSLVLAMVVPLGEEVFFRGAVFGALRRGGRSALVASWVTGLGFLLSHMEPKLWPALALVAAALTALRALSGSLIPGFAFHIGFNGFAVLDATWGVFGPEDRWVLSGRPELWISLALCVGLALLFGSFGSGERYAELRAQDVEDGR